MSLLSNNNMTVICILKSMCFISKREHCYVDDVKLRHGSFRPSLFAHHPQIPSPFRPVWPLRNRRTGPGYTRFVLLSQIQDY